MRLLGRISQAGAFLFLALALAETWGADATGDHVREARRVPVTVAEAEVRTIEVWEPSVGRLEAVNAPNIAAEVGGRIIAVEADVGRKVEAGDLLARIDPEDYRLAKRLAEADIERLKSLIRARELQVRRLRSLLRQKSVNRSALDEAEAELGALRAQLLGARVRLEQAERNIARARITSPVSGKVDARHVSVGDYVKAGTPLFRLTSSRHLRVWLPFPESLSGRLRVGSPVRLRSPMAPDRTVLARVSDLRPAITPANRAIEAIVDLDNPGGWEPGASVTGALRIERIEHAVVVPEISVVRRPAGTVVYVLENGTARQRLVQTGLRQQGWVEIRAGIRAGEKVIRDGAGLLTDGTPVEVKRQ